MITVKIDDAERRLDDADPQWIHEQIGRREADGHTVCVRVSIESQDANLHLATPTCGSSGGGVAQLRPLEQQIVDLWLRRGLGEPTFASGNLVAFLQQVVRLL
ncbi:MAG TPA: hypothetical protein VMS76_19940 [Planctomycetota bacterium]|nr:hypothetical protein [Planctomycetota bacterium]